MSIRAIYPRPKIRIAPFEQPTYPPREVLAVYADGACVGRNPSTHGGTWAWCWVSTEERIVEQADPHLLRSEAGYLFPKGTFTTRLDSRISPYRAVTNNHTEYLAVLLALRDLPEGWEGAVYTDSSITLGRFAKGWKETNIPPEWSEEREQILSRLGRVRWRLVKGHPTPSQLRRGQGARGEIYSSFNVWCDREAERLASDYWTKGARC